ncbi:CBK1 kinase activator protein MOB2 [Lachnellula suecica]|uniref:CBK1 kinase activator protein MOB2 n=1 Tax=Lachnellula suecica TaxID=602035 RepID=A0A8T9C886_9HELO|nr:CBK1 kinase activator protein MOB2 [Lachnellula suecica]
MSDTHPFSLSGSFHHQFTNSSSSSSGRFRRSPGAPNGAQPASPTGAGPSPSIHSSSSTASLAPRVPPLPNSPSLSQTMAMNDSSNLPAADPRDPLSVYNLPRPKPLWLNDSYAKHIVKGNFMTLSARPKTVEPGEWIAHQVVEHYRNLWNFVRVIHEKDEEGNSICNPQTCPRMSAGVNHSFTWLNSRKEPVEVPAQEYISLMQRWISGKIDNTSLFPTDPAGVSFASAPAAPNPASATYASGGLDTPGSTTPIPAGPTSLNASLSQLAGPGDWIGKSSGFPAEFLEVCQTIFRQMFRVYAHLYWAHFVEPFYHLNLEKPLNSCFSHFVLTATALDMLKPQELEPMQPLIDLWAANGTFPKESKAYSCANIKAGERLLAIAGTQ